MTVEVRTDQDKLWAEEEEAIGIWETLDEQVEGHVDCSSEQDGGLFISPAFNTCCLSYQDKKQELRRVIPHLEQVEMGMYPSGISSRFAELPSTSLTLSKKLLTHPVSIKMWKVRCVPRFLITYQSCGPASNRKDTKPTTAKASDGAYPNSVNGSSPLLGFGLRGPPIVSQKLGS
jgi:hypothetical protein